MDSDQTDIKLQYIICLYGDTSHRASLLQLLDDACKNHNINRSCFHVADAPCARQVKLYCQYNEVIGVYFATPQQNTISADDALAFQALLREGCLIYPVIHASKNFHFQLGGNDTLKKYNVSRYAESKDESSCTCLPSALVEDIFCGLHISCPNKKIFISYKRTDTKRIANQLYDDLTLRGYEVFLDTTCIKSGCVFQNRLMDSLNCADIILLLHSEEINESEWVCEELIQAEARGVTIVHLQWPDVRSTKSDHHIAAPIMIEALSTAEKPEERELISPSCAELCEKIEKLRVIGLAARRNRIAAMWKTVYKINEDSIRHISYLDDMQILHVSDTPPADRHILLCHSVPSSLTLYRQLTQKAATTATIPVNHEAYCLLEGYTKERSQHFSWLCDKAGICHLPKVCKRAETLRIFLSASRPKGERKDAYLAEPKLIKECVRSLVRNFVPISRIVFGGHPAISPFVLSLANAYGAKDNIDIYQSEFFREQITKEVKVWGEERVHWTDISSRGGKFQDCRKASLEKMRDEMIAGDFTAAFFIGGMDGVEDEYKLFRKKFPSVPAFLMASTGGAARQLYKRHGWPHEWGGWEPEQGREMAEGTNYDEIFSQILDVATS